MFGSKEPWKIFGPEIDEVRGKRTKLHENLHYLYSSLNIVRVMKPKRIRWAGNVVRMAKMRETCRVWWENLKKVTAWKS